MKKILNDGKLLQLLLKKTVEATAVAAFPKASSSINETLAQ
jgi:hypothetical protein